MSQKEELVVALSSPFRRLVTVLSNINRKKVVEEYQTSVLYSNRNQPSISHVAHSLSIPVQPNVKSLVSVRRLLSPVKM